ncbi:hypothetical protein JX265_002212 [Neoarthrinium moseri]|uniref:Uncharacterized protein n=1 Tax=Neoarthrinium moseri TaxID=1658444 RepID=A0A9P9WU06_9PEZI|nr:hypothetical protein JX266_004172 [Neoarthrinium moseri]KAI1879258.1 hypothetical protein JX265_002212 [Neoarthrinium moseri]
MASIAGVAGYPNFSAYVASKHGVVGSTKAAAHEVAPRGISVDAVCPNYVNTGMYHELAQGRDLVEHSSHLFKRLVEPEEVTSLVGFLLSDESKFMTKTAYLIDERALS